MKLLLSLLVSTQAHAGILQRCLDALVTRDPWEFEESPHENLVTIYNFDLAHDRWDPNLIKEVEKRLKFEPNLSGEDRIILSTLLARSLRDRSYLQAVK